MYEASNETRVSTSRYTRENTWGGGGAVEGNIVTVETTSSSNVLRNCDLDVVVFAGFIVAAVYCSTGIDSISGPPPTTKARNR